ERERGILEYSAAFQDNIIAKLFRRSNSYFDAPIGRAQIITGLRHSILNERARNEYQRYQGRKCLHRIPFPMACRNSRNGGNLIRKGRALQTLWHEPAERNSGKS